VLVNNAGYAVYGPFEATTRAQVARQFNTNVTGNCGLRSIAEAYGNILKRGQKRAGETAIRTGSAPWVVARAIYQAATDASWRLRYPVGNDAWQVSLLRRLLPEGMFYWLLEKAVLD